MIAQNGVGIIIGNHALYYFEHPPRIRATINKIANKNCFPMGMPPYTMHQLITKLWQQLFQFNGTTMHIAYNIVKTMLLDNIFYFAFYLLQILIYLIIDTAKNKTFGLL